MTNRPPGILGYSWASDKTLSVTWAVDTFFGDSSYPDDVSVEINNAPYKQHLGSDARSIGIPATDIKKLPPGSSFVMTVVFEWPGDTLELSPRFPTRVHIDEVNILSLNGQKENWDKKGAPQKSWTWKGMLLPEAIVAAGMTTCIYGVAALWRASRKERIGALIFITIIVAFGVLGRNFPAVDHAIDRTTLAVIRISLLILFYDAAFMVPIMAFRWLSMLFIFNLRLRFQIIVLVAWGLILSGALVLIATRSGRKRMFELL